MKKDSNISGILAETEKLKDANIELEISLKKLQETQEKMAPSSDKFSRAYQDNAVSLRKVEAALKSNNEQVDKNIKMLDMGKTSLEKNKALLESLKDQYVALTGTQGDSTVGASKLNTQIGLLSKTVDDQEKKLEKSREVFDAHKESVDALSSASERLKASNTNFGPILQSATEGFNAMKTGLSAVKTGFNSVGNAIKTTGFGLLLIVLESLTEYFTTDKTGIKQFKGAMAALGLVIDGIKNAFGVLRHAIAEAIMNPGETIKKLWNGVVENLGNRFKALGVILDGVMHFSPKKIADGVIQLSTGVTNGTDKIKKAYNDTKKAIVDTADTIKKTYKEGAAAEDNAAKKKKAADDLAKKRGQEKEAAEKKRQAAADKRRKADSDHLEAIAKFSEATFKEFAKEVNATEAHFNTLEKKYKNSAAKLKQIEQDKADAFAAIAKKFRADDEAKLDEYQHQLRQMAIDNLTDTKEQSIKQLELDTEDKIKAIEADDKKVREKIAENEAAIIKLKKEHKLEEAEILEKSIATKIEILANSNAITKNIKGARDKKINEINNPGAKPTDTPQPETKGTEPDVENVANDPTIKQQQQLLDLQYAAAIKAAKKQGDDTSKIDADYAKKKAELEDKLVSSKIHAGDKYIDAVLKNSKKDSAIYKAAFLAKKATAIADTIVSTKRAVIDSLKAYSGIPFIGQALGIAQAAFMAAQGAASIAEIAKQKPGFASGGRFISDGRGALLPGYSRTDNTNAYLRSGEAVVVSEAMRNPWARNLVSAINVAHGGRDFSMPNTGRGYAIGGIFTDGGNANRYYNQPVNDAKELANTLAYQMINNFPPIYVDVKDVNNQQNILAQTVNRVNL